MVPSPFFTTKRIMRSLTKRFGVRLLAFPAVIAAVFLVSCNLHSLNFRNSGLKDKEYLNAVDGGFGLSIPICVNGHELAFVVDSGATYTALSKSSSDKLQLSVKGGGIGYAYTGQEIPVLMVQCDTISVGRSFHTRDQYLRAITLDNGGFNLDGLLGWDYLRRLKVVADFKERRVSIGGLDSTIAGSALTKLEVETGEFSNLYVKGTVCGIAGYFKVDSGCDLTAIDDVFLPATSEPGAVITASGTKTWRSGAVEDMHVLGRTWAGEKVAFIRREKLSGGFSRGRVLGVIGSDLLKKAGAIIDFGNATIYIRP
jgi:hypothetical protein